MVNLSMPNFALREVIEDLMVKEKAKCFKTEAEAATKIQAVFRGWSLREANEAMKGLYSAILLSVHVAPWERGRPDPVCMREMVYALGWDGVENDPLYSLLTELQETGYWNHNWAPLMDDNERVHLFTSEDAEEIEPAMDAISVYIKRFNAASKIQAVSRGFLRRQYFNFSEAVRINPNDYTDNAPPDSVEGLKLDDCGHVEGHPNWRKWIPNLNLWVYQCDCQILTWWWDSSKRVWVRDTTSAFFERFEGKW